MLMAAAVLPSSLMEVVPMLRSGNIVLVGGIILLLGGGGDVRTRELHGQARRLEVGKQSRVEL
jgi:hypothetical protein